MRRGVEHLVDEVRPGGINDVDVAQTDDEVFRLPEFRSWAVGRLLGLNQDEERSSFFCVEFFNILLNIFNVGQDIIFVKAGSCVDEVDDGP